MLRICSVMDKTKQNKKIFQRRKLSITLQIKQRVGLPFLPYTPLWVCPYKVAGWSLIYSIAKEKQKKKKEKLKQKKIRIVLQVCSVSDKTKQTKKKTQREKIRIRLQNCSVMDKIKRTKKNSRKKENLHCATSL